ncbi:formylglycine-generating enzyme family protein [Peptostreptococcus canis]|uniref:SUMF1/EgtB/PvdO family nonheme iron enzyme n=1 Tax=Peptostreptococcus canis TaxID=1159213 RepID=A0ABR6TIZ3_9FIRM|nr:SUMF1/EgtB/PvdO family nonheme iron enzyme [Peptostreptococcus canis]MBC2575386.1 SUMF1/EgtB/PvdO family nonheme iron enzyme [Peptostreptococcus canis]MBP1997430.1 formylglycine-generating enzyme required for sulfatase activity [Peptostreptococcus canis]
MNLMEYIKENMVLISDGQELIRDFVDPIKWLSSNYKMSVPGTNKEKVVREELVTVQSFSLLKTPVTNELYNYVMEMDSDIQTKDYPVVNVSWVDAIKFCNILSEKLSLEKCYTLNSVSEKIVFDNSKNGFRLPTEAEWQYACRANTKGYRYDNIEEIAWFKENSDGKLCEVKRKKENNFGIFDTIGNVWEWCFDLYDEERYGNYRVFRGGSFASEERACGVTSRRKSFPEFRIDDLGFRIAKNNLEGIQ